MLTLLRLPFLTPSCGTNSRFPRVFARRYAKSSDTLLCFPVLAGWVEALATGAFRPPDISCLQLESLAIAVEHQAINGSYTEAKLVPNLQARLSAHSAMRELSRPASVYVYDTPPRCSTTSGTMLTFALSTVWGSTKCSGRIPSTTCCGTSGWHYGA
jgi:hypothetical protein